MRQWLFVPILALLLGGCANQGPNEQTGMVIGGILGGVLGHQVGDGRGRAMATIIGTIAGAAIGGSIGQSMDELDRMWRNSLKRRYYPELLARRAVEEHGEALDAGAWFDTMPGSCGALSISPCPGTWWGCPSIRRRSCHRQRQ